MTQHIIGLDQGTTGTTAILFDEKQNLIAKTYREHHQYFPKPGWVEHDPEEIFQNTIQLISELIKNSGIYPQKIKGIGITNQRETSIVWDKKTSKSVYPAIVWQCRRTSELCDQFKKIPRLEQKIKKMTGLTVDPYFSATKFSWILKNIPKKNNFDLACGTIDSWLIWRLTKGKSHLTDMTNASRTMLFDIRKLEWSKDLCAQFKIPMNFLPKVQPSISHFGNIHPDFFGIEIPIVGVLGDQQASLLGHNATEPFQAKCTFGTGAFALVHTGNKLLYSKHKLLTTLACSKHSKSQYALEGSVFMAGSIIQWLRDELKIINKASEMDDLAQKIPNNEGVYLVPAFVGLGAPYWKPDARATLSGMHLGTNRSHIARATLEAIAYQVHDLFRALEKDLGKKIKELHVDGGVTNSRFLMQFLANILQIPIQKTDMFEMTAFGAARAAAMYFDLWSEVQHNHNLETFFPNQTPSLIKPLIKGWESAIKRTLFNP